MSDRFIQSMATGMLMVAFIVVAALQLRLWWRLRSRDESTDLGSVMEHKYMAWAIASIMLAVLQGYSLWFNITGTVGVFTFPVRNTIRVMAVAAMFVAAWWMHRMVVEVDRAESTLMGLKRKGNRDGTETI